MARNLQQKEKLKNYACEEDGMCEKNCARINIWKSPKWFDGWVKGNPFGDCPYFIGKLTEQLFKDD